MEHVEGKVHLPSSFNYWFSSLYTCSCSPRHIIYTITQTKTTKQNKKQYKNSKNRTEKVEKDVEHDARIA